MRLKSVSFTGQIMEGLESYRIPVFGWDVTLMEVDDVFLC
jgi:hypothetical protein